MKIHNISTFTTIINRVELNLKLKNLLKVSLDQQKNKNSNKLSNVGGFQSKNLDKTNKNLSPLLKEIDISINKIAKEVYDLKTNLQVDNIWCNINEYKDSNLMHHHPFSILSGVFYAKVPKNSGEIAFYNDSPIDDYIHDSMKNNFNNINAKTWVFPAEENVIYIFPSWLKHVVNQNLSNEKRISFSFNTIFKGN